MRRNRPEIGIIDLESNNLYSIYNSFLISGFKPKIISPKEKSFKYDLVVMPGVGAFKTGMGVIKKYYYDDKIHNYLNKPNSFLYGICLGMQLLFSSSQEFGYSNGLKLINGKVKKFSKQNSLKTNMGWARVSMKKEELLLNKQQFDKNYFYFVHSYYVSPSDNKDIFGISYHQDFKFTSIIKKRNIFGTQFHPEKSGKTGISFLKNLKNSLN